MLPDGRAGRLVVINFVPHEEEIRPTGTYIMALGISREELDNTLSRVFQGLCLAGLALVLGTFPGIWLSVRRALESLDLLGRQTSTIEADNLSFRFPVSDVPLELRPISARLNNLLSIGGAFEQSDHGDATLNYCHWVRPSLKSGLEAPSACLCSYFEDAYDWRHMVLVTLFLTLSRCDLDCKSDGHHGLEYRR